MWSSWQINQWEWTALPGVHWSSIQKMALPGVKLQHQMDDITWSKTSASNGWHYLVLESSIQWMALPRVRLQHPMDDITWSGSPASNGQHYLEWDSSIQWTALPAIQHPMDGITLSVFNYHFISLAWQLTLPSLTPFKYNQQVLMTRKFVIKRCEITLNSTYYSIDKPVPETNASLRFWPISL